MIETSPVNAALSGRIQGQPQEKLRKACADFESLFLNYMLKSMRASVPEGGITEQSEEGKMFQSMFDENLANEISSSGGLGLGDILFKQLSERE